MPTKYFFQLLLPKIQTVAEGSVSHIKRCINAQPINGKSLQRDELAKNSKTLLTFESIQIRLGVDAVSDAKHELKNHNSPRSRAVKKLVRRPK